MSQHLFLFTIGPVQSFIAQARKTQDLYAGSRLLSELSKAAADAIKAKGGKVIFPSNTEGESLPNRLLAEFTNVVEAELKQKGESIANTIETVIEKYRKNAENKLGATA
jgi:CRISPR-associated protein Cmr2